MSAGKHVSRISAESRWQEGIFLGILGGGVGASDYAVGTPDGVQPARAIKMVPEVDAWDIELLLAVKGLPWDRRRADPAARIRLPAPEVPPEHVLPPPVGEPAGPRPRRVYIRRDVGIRKYGVTIGCPGCMAIKAGTTAQGHSDECRARIEQKMLEDVTGEGAMRLEEAIGRKRARPDDESSRADVAMEVAARNPIRPVQYGGSSSSWEARPEPSRRREAEEMWSEQDCRILRVLCVQQNRRGYSPMKSLRQLWIQSVNTSKSWERCTWQNPMSVRCSCQGVRRSWGAHSASSQVRLWTCGLDGIWLRQLVDRSAGRRYMQNERPELVIGSPLSRRHSPRIKHEREARIQGVKHLNFCCAVYRWQTERGVHFLHEHPWGASSWDMTLRVS